MEGASPTPIGPIEVTTYKNVHVKGGRLQFTGSGVNVRSIDTTNMDIYMFSKVDYHTPVQSIPALTFTLEAVPASGPRFPIWSAQTIPAIGPIAGFTLPRQVFVLPTPANFIRLELSATPSTSNFDRERVGLTSNAVVHSNVLVSSHVTSNLTVFVKEPYIVNETHVISQEFIYPVTGRIQWSSSLPPHMNAVYPPPQIVRSYSSNELPLTIGTGLSQATDPAASAGRPSLTWFVCSNSFGTSNDIPGVTFDHGVLIGHGAAYNGAAYIVAKSMVSGLVVWQEIYLNVAETPSLIIPAIPAAGILQASMTRYQDFIYQMQLNTSNCGLLTWSMYLTASGAGSTLPPALFLESAGLITFERYNNINENVTVVVNNSAGGTDSVTFLLNICQIPKIVQITNNSIICGINDDLSYQLNESDVQPPSLLTWSIAPPSSAYYIDQHTGMLHVLKNNYVNTDVTVTVTNPAGGLDRYTFLLNVIQAPTINMIDFPNGLLNPTISADSNVYQAMLSQTDIGMKVYSLWSQIGSTGEMKYTQVGSFTASIGGGVMELDTNLDTYISLVRNNLVQTGTLALWSLGSDDIYDNPSVQSVTFTNFGTLTADKTQEGAVTVRVDTDFSTYPAIVTLLTQSFGQLGVDMVWKIDSIVPNTSDSSIAVTLSPLGVLTASLADGYIDVNLTVSLTTTYGAASATTNTTFRFLAIQPPRILEPPGGLIASLNPGQIFSYQFINIPPGCGPIEWALTCSNSNVSFDAISSTVQLSYESNTYVNENIEITATSSISLASNVLSVTMNVQQTPIFNMYNPIFTYARSVPALQHTMQKGVPYIVNMDVVVANPWGVDFTTISWSDDMNSRHSYIDPASGILTVHNNVYINQTVELKITTSAGGSAVMNPLLHVMQAVEIKSPGNIVARTTTSDFYVKLYQFTEYPGSNTWYITDPTGSAILGVTITTIFDELTNTQVPAIECSKDMYIDSPAVLYNINELGDRQSVPLTILVAKDPHPLNIVGNQQALMVGNSNFQYPFADINFYNINDSNAVGPIVWSISAYPGLTISDSGLITFKNHHVITDYVTVTATNSTAGSVSSTFYMDISEQIQLSDLTQLPYSMAYATNFSFSLAKSLGASSATWSLTPTSPLISIDSQTGVLTASSNSYINDQFEITVTQNNGTPQTQLVQFIIAQTPIVAFRVPAILVSLSGSDTIITPGSNQALQPILNQTAIQTGPLTWNIAPASPFITVKQDTGVITISKYATYINNVFTVSAANQVYSYNGTGISQPGIQMIIAQAPAIIVGNITINVDSSDEYIAPAIQYALSTAPTVPISDMNYTGPLTWTVSQGTSSNAPPPVGLSIDTLGQLHLAAGKYIYNTQITVTASTLALGKDTKTTVLSLVRIPVVTLNQPPLISIDYGVQTDFTLQVFQTRSGCGPLTWSIYPSNISGLTVTGSAYGGIATVTLSVATQIYSDVTVTASNCIGGTGSVTFFMQKIHPPVIAPIPSPQSSSNASIPWYYTVHEDLTQMNGVSAGIGTVWSISPAQGLSIGNNVVAIPGGSNTAVVTFQPNNYINGPVTVKATNALGSNSSTTFQLSIMDTPVISRPTISVTNTGKSNWTFQFVPTNVNVAGNLTWNLIDNANPDLSIDSTSGLLTLAYSNVTGRGGYSQPPPFISSGQVIIRASNSNAYSEVDASITVYNAIELARMGSDPQVSIYKPSITDLLAVIYNFTSITFTSAGVDGQSGPSIDKCITAYVSTQVPWPVNPIYFKVPIPGYQTWLVPETTTYSVIVAGAPGGCFSDTPVYGGCAAVICGPMTFIENHEIAFIIGQRPSRRTVAGINPNAVPGCGGGGGTFIIDLASPTAPLLAVGGGGGATASINGAAATDFAQSAIINPGSGYTAAASNEFIGSTNGVSNDSGCSGGFGGGGAGIIGSGGGGGGWSAGAQGMGGSSYSQTNVLGISPVYGNQMVNMGYVADGIKNGMAWIFKLPATPPSGKAVITFTNCGQTGNTGPLWTQMQAAYTGNSDIMQYLYPGNWAQRQGYQAWIVPSTGMYTITCVGACGGDIQQSSFINLGGRGASITAKYVLSAGDVLIITVGQQGWGGATGGSLLFAGGGGGMSSVHRNGMYMLTSDSRSTIPFPLLCAGGGPGAPGGTGNNANGNDAPYTSPITGTSGSSSSGGPTCGGGLYQGSGLTGAWQDIKCMQGAAGGNLGGFGGFGGGAPASTSQNISAGPGGGWTGGVQGSNAYQSLSVTPTGGTSYYYSGPGYMPSSLTVTSGNYPVPAGTARHGYVSIQQV